MEQGCHGALLAAVLLKTALKFAFAGCPALWAAATHYLALSSSVYYIRDNISMIVLFCGLLKVRCYQFVNPLSRPMTLWWGARRAEEPL